MVWVMFEYELYFCLILPRLPLDVVSKLLHVNICILPSKTTYVHQDSDEISITSGQHVSAVKQSSSGQCRTYTRYNVSVHSMEFHIIYIKFKIIEHVIVQWKEIKLINYVSRLLKTFKKISHVICLFCCYIQHDGKAFKYILKNKDRSASASYVCCS